jgi:hypothetical protein
MPKYIVIYHAPMMPPDAQPTPEQMEAAMGEWNAWGERVGEGLVSFGSPLAGGTRVTSDGTSPSTLEVSGYSVVEADDMDAAVALMDGHPHLATPGNTAIELHEVQPMPGM